uniref:Uncharacterized protein n=1 Tax=Hucho hucho TaxID=62062 RepID=A0A4W5KG50_9TELE
MPELLADDHVETGGAQVQVASVESRGCGKRKATQPDDSHQTPAELATHPPANGIGHNDVPVQCNGCEGQDGCENRCRLHQGDKVAHEGYHHQGKHQGKQHQGKHHQGKQHQGKQHQGKHNQGKHIQGKQHQRKQHQGKHHQGKQHQGK